jgi:predicted enzyme related to lactoylglutathione lyase
MDTQTQDQHSINQGRTFVWHECYVPDVAQAIEFYTKALGFGTQEMPMAEMGTYTMLTRNGMAVGGIMSTSQPMMEGVPPHWSTYLSVEDVDAAVTRCLGMGASVVVPAMDVPTVGRMCLISDNQGAHIWLFKGA